MVIKALFEGPVGDYCIARNTIKCLLNIHSLHDIHGIMSIIYKQTIKVNIEANNVCKGHMFSIATGEAITGQICTHISNITTSQNVSTLP